jgi:hypothetical protein
MLSVSRLYSDHARFEVFTVVVMKSIIFWDVTPCSLLSFNRRFGGTYRLHLQGRRNNCQQCLFLLKLFLRPWRWRRHVPTKRRFQLSRLHGVTSQKMILLNNDHDWMVNEWGWNWPGREADYSPDPQCFQVYECVEIYLHSCIIHDVIHN